MFSSAMRALFRPAASRTALSSRAEHHRQMSVRAKKRFYKDVSVVSSGGDYEITLDSKKLKTPGGSVMTLGNQSLALAVAHEWQAQKDQILLSQMHLTGLCNTAIDNPTNATKYDLVDDILNFLDTDTLLFFAENEEKLLNRQFAEWQPVIDWFCERYEVDVAPSATLFGSPITPENREKIRRHLLSHNFEAVHGFCFGVDAIKSIILMSAVADGKLTASQAVKLSRLELDYQTDFWGNVEWAHDLELHDTNARVAAAAMFIHFHNTNRTTTKK